MSHFFDKQRSTQGQVAIVLILFIAIGLVLYAATGNLSNIARTKISTIKAANSSAAQMVSLMASYGESLFVQNLGRKNPKCNTEGGLWKAVLGIVIMVAAIIATGGLFGAVFAGSFLGIAATTWGYIFAIGMIAMEIALTGSHQLVTGGQIGPSTGWAVSYIDPRISETWNEAQSTDMSSVDSFVEQGIQAGLRNIVTDYVEVPDVDDMDQDKRFVTRAELTAYDKDVPGTYEDWDWINRFSFYNTRRLMPPDLNVSADKIKSFIRALKNFVLVDDDSLADPDGAPTVEQPDGRMTHSYVDWPAPMSPATLDWVIPDPYLGSMWGLIDPVNCGANSTQQCCPQNGFWGSVSSVCNPCCVPEDTGGSDLERIRPEFCESINTGGVSIEDLCRANSPYYDSGTSFANQDEYKYVYDLAFEDHHNDFVSLRERFGTDDQHRDYRTTPSAYQYENNQVYYIETSTGERVTLPYQYENHQFYTPEGSGMTWAHTFTAEDASDFYDVPNYSLTDPDRRHGIFPLLWRLGAWGVDLDGLKYGTQGSPATGYRGDWDDYQCHWCDERADSAAVCPSDDSGQNWGLPGAVQRLSLPNDYCELSSCEECDPSGVCQARYSGGWCVDGNNFLSTQLGLDAPPVRPDLVPGIPQIGIPSRTAPFPPANECASGPGPEEGESLSTYWKPGSDEFCSANDPYSAVCPKHLNPNPAADPLRCDSYPECHDGLEDYCCPAGFKDYCFDFDEDEGLVIPRECECGETNADQWPDDNFDVFVTKMVPEIYKYSQWLLQENPRFLAARFAEWYGDVADYIEPYCTPGDCPDGSTDCDRARYCPDTNDTAGCCPASFTNEARWGELFRWRDFLEKVRDALNSWRTASTGPTGPTGIYISPSCYNSSDPDSKNDMAWCVPPKQVATNLYGVSECEGITLAESYAIEDSLPGKPFTYQRGSIRSILQCLAYNISHPTYVAALDQWVRGNAQKFELCYDYLDKPEPATEEERAALQAQKETVCKSLPRSLVPGFTSTYYNPKDIPGTINGNYTGNPPDPAAFKAYVYQSYIEAQNQIEKFTKRRDALNKIWLESGYAINFLDQAVKNFTLFLEGLDSAGKPTPFATPGPGNDGDINEEEDNTETDSPAEQLIWDRHNSMAEISRTLPSVAVYVWKDEDRDSPDDSGDFEGSWHAAKVEVRLPMRCNQACSTDGNSGQEEWPAVKSRVRKHSFSTKICYYMANTSGWVKARVIRYDQPRQSWANIKFPSGLQIWKPRLSHPDIEMVTSPQTLVDEGDDCEAQVDHLLAANADAPWRPAFMLNKKPYRVDSEGARVDPEYDKCWDRVHDLLRQGVVTETCAEYFLGGPDGYRNLSGFRMKFVNCDDDFLKGNN